MKELKSYIHLYIGCKVQWTRSDWQLVTQDLTLSDASWLRERKDAKLILRPLESMTSEESVKLLGSDKIHFYKKGKSDNPFDLFLFTPKEFCALIGESFDLFGLKEAGLAVYETEIKK